MRRALFPLSLTLFLLCTLLGTSAVAQTATISGTTSDLSSAALAGAEIRLQPTGMRTVSDNQGHFSLAGVAPGKYTLTISYVGFATLQLHVTAAANQVTSIPAVLQVATQSQQVLVTSSQASGDAEAINLERSTSNILDVLPAKVITSLPNTGVAAAVGRLSSVTTERDEGAPKYVQIRGTEPRLSNTTIDGIEVPSPEGGVRNVRLDTIPSDLVDSVQIYKTLEADQPGDAIGGSVNLQTKMAGEEPTLSVFGTGGFTPIINTVPVGGLGVTAGRRFGVAKKLGVMFSGSFDYNGRGIDDIEPLPIVQAGPAQFSDMDIRQYYYDRRRGGGGLDLEYKLGPNSRLWARSLFSQFDDWGHRYDYALSTVPNANSTNPVGGEHNLYTERRLQGFQIADLILGGDHAAGKWSANWEASVARSEMKNPINGGEAINSFAVKTTTQSAPDPNNPGQYIYSPALVTPSNCQYTGATDPHLPQFNSACYSELYNTDLYSLQSISDTFHGKASQLNLQGSASVSRSYTWNSHVGLLQFGGWFSNAHKFDDSYEYDYTSTALVNNQNDPTTQYNNDSGISMTNFVDSFHNGNYYNGAYKFGHGIGWEASNKFLEANPGDFMMTTTKGGNSNNFDLVEKISAGYIMNTLDWGRFNLIAGLRFEGTNDTTYSFDATGASSSPWIRGGNSYVDPLPSASLQIKLDSESDLRLAYGRGISRPDPQYLTASLAEDASTFPPTITVGNPKLVPEHANDVDVLYERFLQPIGMIRSGFFYKNISDPLVTEQRGPGPDPICTSVNLSNCYVVQSQNAGSAYIAGLEFSFEQHFTYLPGLLSGTGLIANYSWATSQATDVNPGNRTDKPALLRQAPSWNIMPSYDKGRLALRGGFAYDGANIYSYSYTDANASAGGINGPGGDLYLFAHLQVDAQASYRLGEWTLLFQGENLNNEVFGFYQGSPQYFIQREYYQPTYSFGFRWDMSHAR
ncbi:MAG TPA: TonB-dependent receptor [Terracidiphilus sp.]|nr:TonB-dependent receptor [Terracidiphilus sp.]